MKLDYNKKIALAATALAITFLSVFTFKLSAAPARYLKQKASSSLPQSSSYVPPPSSGKAEIKDKSESESESKSEFVEAFGDSSVNIMAVGIDATKKLTDVIMLARVDLDNGKIAVLHIPRDTFVGDNVPTGKINAIYGSKNGGINKLREKVEDITALNVDYYATITLEGLRKVIDNLGGVEIDIPLKINYLPGKVIEKGLQQIDGEKAEWIVRYRAGYASGDLGRINTQKLLIEALLKKLKEQGRLASLAAAAKNYKYVSTDLPISKLISLANEAFGIDVKDIEFYTAPGYGIMHNGFAVYGIYKENLSQILNKSFRKEDEGVKSSYLKIPQPTPD